jgi:hypothetical protein
MLELGTVDDEIDDRYVAAQSFKRKNILSQEEAHFWFTYDWKEGVLKHRWAHYLRNDKAGWAYKSSLRFMLMGKVYSVATTIWTMFFGEVPNDFVVEYKDGDWTNTRIENLFIRHYSFISRKKAKSSSYRFEKSYTGVSYVETDLGKKGWQAKFKGHSSFGNVSRQSRVYDDIEHARRDYVKFKTEYMRGLFVFPLWQRNEKVYIEQDKFLEPDMVAYFNTLPVHEYQLKYCYKDPYLSNKVLPDMYSLGDCTNLQHPLIVKYFEKYETVFKSRSSHLKLSEKKRLRDLLKVTQVLYRLPAKERYKFEEVLFFLSFAQVRGHTKHWTDTDKELLNRALKTYALINSEQEVK